MAAWHSNPQGSESRARLAGPHLVADNPASEAQLARVVELEVIPRLLLMHALPGRVPSGEGLRLGSAHVSTLAELAVDRDAQAAGRFTATLVAAGATPRQLLLDLLAPCARQMGTWWSDDLFSFSEVTLGLWRLQQLLHEQLAALRPTLRRDAPAALFSALPGSQHSFGPALLAECFAQAGWRARYEPPSPSDEGWAGLQSMLANDRFVIFGLSISRDVEVASIASAIFDLRQASCNPALRVLVGGPLALVRDDLAAVCGADAQALDADAALALARQWAGASPLPS